MLVTKPGIGVKAIGARVVRTLLSVFCDDGGGGREGIELIAETDLNLVLVGPAAEIDPWREQCRGAAQTRQIAVRAAKS